MSLFVGAPAVIAGDWGFALALIGFSLLIITIGAYTVVTHTDIFYDAAYIYVETLRRSTKYDIKKVRRLNGCYGGWDWKFQIEFYPEKGGILKIDYSPPRSEARRYIWTNEFSGRSQAFQAMLKEIQSMDVSSAPGSAAL